MRSKHGPEYTIQERLIKFLKDRGWLVERLVGNAFQRGIPDLYIHHLKYGPRWIDVKNPGDYEFTKHQRQKWPIWERYGVGIWILTAADEDEYAKLFKKPNWREFWKTKYDEEIQEMKDALDELYNTSDGISTGNDDSGS